MTKHYFFNNLFECIKLKIQQSPWVTYPCETENKCWLCLTLFNILKYVPNQLCIYNKIARTKTILPTYAYILKLNIPTIYMSSTAVGITKTTKWMSVRPKWSLTSVLLLGFIIYFITTMHDNCLNFAHTS